MFGILKKDYKWARMTQVRGNLATELLSYFDYQRPIDIPPLLLKHSKVKTTGSRYSLNMISAVTAKGYFRFMTAEGSVNAEIFCDFIKRLIKGVNQKVFLILDNFKVHHSRKVKKLVESLQGKIQLFYLPAYPPELNPDELVWSHVNQNVGRATEFSKGNLKHRVIGALRSLQRMPDKVCSFFSYPKCCYTVA